MESQWRAQAERNSSLRCSLPAVRSEKRNEAARLKHGGAKSIMTAFDQLQVLIFDIAHRHNHSSVFSKLRKKRRRDRGRRRSHENGIVRGELRQTQRSVAAVHVNILAAEARETLAGFSGQCRAKLHGEDLARQAGQHGGLIAKSRSDFQYPFVPLKAQRRGHGGYNVRLRNRLALPDGERGVLVSAVAKFRGDEFMAWHALKAL